MSRVKGETVASNYICNDFNGKRGLEIRDTLEMNPANNQSLGISLPRRVTDICPKIQILSTIMSNITSI